MLVSSESHNNERNNAMNLNSAYPSRFLSAEDLNGQDVTVTISNVTQETLGQGKDAQQKLVAEFAGKKKAMVLNKTNAKTIAKLYGDETDEWVGKKITIGPREVEFQGDLILALRVSLKAPAAGAAPAKAAKPAPAAEPADQDGNNVENSDDVGF